MFSLDFTVACADRQIRSVMIITGRTAQEITGMTARDKNEDNSG